MTRDGSVGAEGELPTPRCRASNHAGYHPGAPLFALSVTVIGSERQFVVVIIVIDVPIDVVLGVGSGAIATVANTVAISDLRREVDAWRDHRPIVVNIVIDAAISNECDVLCWTTHSEPRYWQDIVQVVGAWRSIRGETS